MRSLPNQRHGQGGEGAVPLAVVDSWRAWMVAVAVGMSNAVAFGTAFSFGAFFDAMAAEFDAGRGAVGLMLGITLLLFNGFGIVSGPTSDRYGLRPLLIVGGSLFCAGLVATAHVGELWMGFISYGFGVGLGAGCWVAPSFATVAMLFESHRAIALGITATGSGIGTTVLVPLAERLIAAHGWRTAFIAFAGIAAVTLTVTVAFLIEAPRRTPIPYVDLMRTVVSTTAFRLLFGAHLLAFVGLFVAFTFVVPFATDEGISSTAAAGVVALIGLVSIVGRVGTMLLARRIHVVRLLQAALALQAMAYFVWLGGGNDLRFLVLFAVILGASYGGFVALGPELMVSFFGMQGAGALMGLLFLSGALGGLLGPPTGGLLADLTDGRIAPTAGITALLVVATGMSLRVRRPA